MNRFTPAIIVAIGALLGMTCFLPILNNLARGVAAIFLIVYILTIIVYIEGGEVEKK